MKLTDVFDRNLFLLDLPVNKKEEVLREIARKVAAAHRLDERLVLRLFQQREEIGTTGMGEGVAVPHIRVHGLRQPVLGFARSKAGVEFASKDGKPVFLLAVLLAPDEDPASHLQLLARVARLFRTGNACQRLRGAPGIEEFVQVLSEEDARL